MSTEKVRLISFLKEVMHRRQRLPSQLAADLGINHSTVIRWLSGADVPNIRSCRRLAEYSGIPLEKILYIVGYLTKINNSPVDDWPEFGEYARKKYPEELDDDLITVIEQLVERRRGKKIRQKR